MRKPFRTTIDENVLSELKKTALEQNINANDIIEELLRKKFCHDYFTQDADKFTTMTPEEKKKYLKKRFIGEIINVLYEVKLYNVNSDTLDVLAGALAELVIRGQEK